MPLTLEIDMGRRTKSDKRICFAALLFILSLAGAGCGDSRQTENQGRLPDSEAEHGFKAGALHGGYFYETGGIALSSGKRFLYSDWEPVEFDYICTDPTCSHLTAGCSARAVSNEGEMQNDFCLLYQDCLILLHAYCEMDAETVRSEDSETEIIEFRSVYYTDVYEADPDGSNRRKIATFPGSINNTIITNVAVLADGKLYFGGPTEERSRWEHGGHGEDLEERVWISDAIYCLDLNDYSIENFAVTKDREGMGYMYQLYEYGGMIYAVISNFGNDADFAVWYRIDPAMGECGEILRVDSNPVRFCGAIGDTMYYFYNDSGKTLYARDIEEGAEEREIMTVNGEDMHVIAFVLDEQILFQTDRVFEGDDRMTEYALLDRNGNLLDTIRYDDYIVFNDVIGDKLIYYRMGSDWEKWWADKEELIDLTAMGTEIGPLVGNRLDVLAD